MTTSWAPTKTGLDALVKEIGQEKAEALIDFCQIQMRANYHEAQGLVPLMEKLLEGGPIFDLSDDINQFAWQLGTTIAIVRGQLRPDGPIPGLNKAIKYLGGLPLPPHPSTMHKRELIPEMEWTYAK